MTVTERTAVASHIAVVFLCGTVAVCAVGLTVALSRTLDGVNTTVAKLNRPCKGSGKDKADNCGTLALAGQDMVDAGDLIKRADHITDLEGTTLTRSLPILFQKASDTMDGANDLMKHASLTADAASQSLHNATDGLPAVEANAAALESHLDAGIAPVLSNANLFLADADGTVKQANLFLASPENEALRQNLVGITHSTDAMLARAKLAEDKATQCYLYPTLRCRINSLIIPTFQVAGPLIQAFR